MTRRPWRTLRVVVEIPVQGDYTEKDLKNDVEAYIGSEPMTFRDARFGRFCVKQGSRVFSRKRKIAP